MHLFLKQYLDALNKSKSGWSMVTLLIIITIGFLLRFWYFHAGHAYHYLAINDEITAYEFALRFMAGDTTTYYLGQPDFAGGKAPGPYFTLFWLLAWLVGGKTPDGALFFVLLCNTGVIFLVYRFATNFLDNRYSLLVTALFASAPWTVYYSLGLWNPIPMVILGAVLLLSLWHTTTKDDSKMIFWVCVVLAIIPHFHMIGLFYVPAVLIVLYAMPSRLNSRWFMAGILAGIGLYLPYLVGDAINNWQNLQAILSGDGKDKFSFSVFKILTAPVGVISNLPSRWVGPEFSEYVEFGDTYFGSYIVLVTFNLISIFFSLYVIYAFLGSFICTLKDNKFSLKRAFSNQQDIVFLGIMLFIPLLFFIPTGHNYATRYTIIIFPLLFVIFGMRIMRLYRYRIKNLLTGGIAVTIIFNIYLNIVFSQHTSRMFESEQHFMPSFRKLEEIQKELARTVNGIPSVSLSPTTEKLTELERTLLSALPQYIDIYYKYFNNQDNRALLHLTLSPPGEVTKDQEIIYQGNGIVLTNKTD